MDLELSGVYLELSGVYLELSLVDLELSRVDLELSLMDLELSLVDLELSRVDSELAWVWAMCSSINLRFVSWNELIKGSMMFVKAVTSLAKFLITSMVSVDCPCDGTDVTVE